MVTADMESLMMGHIQLTYITYYYLLCCLQFDEFFTKQQERRRSCLSSSGPWCGGGGARNGAELRVGALIIGYRSLKRFCTGFQTSSVHVGTRPPKDLKKCVYL